MSEKVNTPTGEISQEMKYPPGQNFPETEHPPTESFLETQDSGNYPDMLKEINEMIEAILEHERVHGIPVVVDMRTGAWLFKSNSKPEKTSP